MGSGKSDDEQQAQQLQEMLDQQGPEVTQERLGELAILAQINDMVSSLLEVVQSMTKEGKNLSDRGLRSQILLMTRKIRERALKIEDFVPRVQDSRRDTTIPPRPERRRR